MSEKYNTYPGGTFFATLTIVGWIDLFTRSEYCDLILENLTYCIKNKGLLVYSYCIMPSHIHLIAGSAHGNLGDIMRDFKGYTSREILKLIEINPNESRKEWILHVFKYYAKYKVSNKIYQLWQHGFHPIDLNTDTLFYQKMEYIENNPVKARIVNLPEQYVYCSVYPQSPLKLEAL